MLPKRGFPSFWERMQVANSASPAGKTQEAEAAALTPPGHGAGAQPNADITALTDSDDFLLELAQALGGLAALRPVDSIEAAIEGLAGKRRAQLLVVDARDANTAFAAVKAAATRAPHVVVLVFAPEAAQAAIAAALRGLAVFALLPTPIDARGAHALLERALTESAASKDADRSTAAGGDALVAPLAPHGARRGPRLAAAAAAVLVAVAAGTYWMVAANRDGASPPRLRLRARRCRRRPRPPARASTCRSSTARSTTCWKRRAPPCAHGITRTRSATMHSCITVPRPPPILRAAKPRTDCSASPACSAIASRRPLTGAHVNEAALALAQIKAAVPTDDRLAAYSQQLAAAVSGAAARGPRAASGRRRGAAACRLGRGPHPRRQAGRRRRQREGVRRATAKIRSRECRDCARIARFRRRLPAQGARRRVGERQGRRGPLDRRGAARRQHGGRI